MGVQASLPVVDQVPCFIRRLPRILDGEKDQELAIVLDFFYIKANIMNSKSVREDEF